MRNWKQHPPVRNPRGFTDASLSGRKFFAHAWEEEGRMRNWKQHPPVRNPQRFYGRITKRPEILCPCLGGGGADAVLE